MEMVRSFIDKN